MKKLIILTLGIVLFFSACNQNNNSKSSDSTKSVVYDIVIENGRVIDPETKTDKVMNVGIKEDKIVKLSTKTLKGRKVLDAKGKIVAPGAIDLHHHSPTIFGANNSNRDGVTTILELEAGSYPVTSAGNMLENKSKVHFGASSSHIMIRIKVIEGKDLGYYDMGDQTTPAWYQKSTLDEIAEIEKLHHQALENGAIGIGLLLDYMTNAITDEELDMVFRVAAEHQVPVFVHVRRYVNGDIRGLKEIIDLAKEKGTHAHICHLNANAMGNYQAWLDAIDDANTEGAKITTEIFPYTAGSTNITADVFTRDWQTIFDITSKDVQISSSGKYFTSLKEFEDYKDNNPTAVIIHHYMKEEWIKAELKYPNMIVSTDAMPSVSTEAKVVPNGIGSYTKLLAHYVRDEKWISLMDAISMSSYRPAKLLENAAPVFKNKGRIQEGADADIIVFDMNKLETKASFINPYQLSTGYDYILTAGQIVVNHDKGTGATPGKRLLAK